jgi:hypothetical protein
MMLLFVVPPVHGWGTGRHALLGSSTACCRGGGEGGQQAVPRS